MSGPTRIEIEDIAIDEQTDSFRQVRLVERSTTGSAIVLGLQWYTPHGDPVEWNADADTHEVFYVTEGRIAIEWDGPDSGTSEVGVGDAFYLAPGRSYAVGAAGAHPASLVWSLTPATG